MFEVWEDRQDSGVWLVFRESPSFPGSFAVDEWSELGTCSGHEVVAAAVDGRGYLLMRSTGMFDPNGTLGPDFEPA